MWVKYRAGKKPFIESNEHALSLAFVSCGIFWLHAIRPSASVKFWTSAIVMMTIS